MFYYFHHFAKVIDKKISICPKIQFIYDFFFHLTFAILIKIKISIVIVEYKYMKKYNIVDKIL